MKKLTLVTLLLCLGTYAWSTIVFVSPFRNTLEEAIVDCDTVFKTIDTTIYEITYIEEWDNGYILKAYSTSDSITVYYYDARDDKKIDIIKD